MEKQELIFLLILSAASLSDLIIPVFMGFRYPGYSHLRDTLSTLGTRISPVSRLEGANLILVGLLLGVFAGGQLIAFDDPRWSHNFYNAGVIIFATGCIMAGIFPEDHKGGKETESGKVHGIASGLGFIFLSLCPLWAAFIDEFSPNLAVNISFFVLGLVLFTLFILSKGREKGFLKYTGLFQRLDLLLLYSSLIINYITLIR